MLCVLIRKALAAPMTTARQD